jgi:hypothetical protein
MAQIFKPTANTYARASILMLGIVPWIAFYSGSLASRSPQNTKVNVPLDQPVPFSHLHHAFELGIDCRYCHYSVEKTAVAGVPETEVCMSCHSQIWTNSVLLEPVRTAYETGTPIKWANAAKGEGWNMVNRLPEFVYFNHSLHIARGINCNQCHGPVQKMAITWKGQYFAMAWCLECHKEPEKYLYSDPEHKDLTAQQQAFLPYMKLQNGDKLTPKQESLMNGETTRQNKGQELAQGKALVEQYNVMKKQLADCWICHR